VKLLSVGGNRPRTRMSIVARAVTDGLSSATANTGVLQFSVRRSRAADLLLPDLHGGVARRAEVRSRYVSEHRAGRAYGGCRDGGDLHTAALCKRRRQYRVDCHRMMRGRRVASSCSDG
jgi:hypothetical protein